MGHFSATDENLGFQSGVPIPGLNPPSNQFGNAFCGAGSGLIREGLGAYGKRICGSSSQYVQSNIIKCFSDPQYYFQVNAHYVRNKLKIILFPFLHRGHWTRITEPIGGRLSYNPPINDINAPDLYIPFMTFATYLVLAGISLGLSGKFSPEALNWQFVKGMASWLFQAMLLKASLTSLGGGEAPLLDMIAYAGYTFTGLCVAVVGRITLSYAYYLIVIWTSMCSGIFLAKTIKLTLYAEARSYDVTIHNYFAWYCIFSIPIHLLPEQPYRELDFLNQLCAYTELIAQILVVASKLTRSSSSIKHRPLMTGTWIFQAWLWDLGFLCHAYLISSIIVELDW